MTTISGDIWTRYVWVNASCPLANNSGWRWPP